MPVTHSPTHNSGIDRIRLVSPPWPLFNRPSLQLGVLKAYLKQELPDLNVVADHFFLEVAHEVGFDRYDALSRRTWPAETVYAALLYPERFDTIARLFQRVTGSDSHLQHVDFQDITERAKSASDRFVDRRQWQDCDLVGFSICLCQLTAGLYLLRRLKQMYPHLTIVIGGSQFSQAGLNAIMKVFPQIDYGILGEGELPLIRLIRFFRDQPASLPDDGPALLTGKFKGIVSRHNGDGDKQSLFDQVKNLENLPVPDFDDYFELLQRIDPAKVFFPTLPAEMSRGCWWHRTSPITQTDGCAFCNLNLQWKGYRRKKPPRIAAEIDTLSTRYRLLNVTFTDNVIPLDEDGAAFKALTAQNKDYQLFGEIRATTAVETLETMRRAGFSEVQIGIEALSPSLLRKLNKGTSAIQNIEIIKNCEALGIEQRSNLILQFPGSDERDVTETLYALDFLLPFRPLQGVAFWLGLGSPVWAHKKQFGLQAVFNHPYFRILFPAHISKSVPFMIQAYRGDLQRQRRLWRPVKAKLEKWQKAYRTLVLQAAGKPLLYYQEGRRFIIIRQFRANAEPVTHRLVGPSREIYLFCRRHRTLKQILERFSRLSVEKVQPFLRMMVDKRLMFAQDDTYLSLAMRLKNEFGP